MLDYMGVSMTLNIPEVPDISPVTIFSKTPGYKESDPPTYHNLHYNTIIKIESKTNTVSP